MRIADLPDCTPTPDAHGVYTVPPFLYCRVCGGEYSAHRGDYFAHPPEGEITCCGEVCSLVRRETRLVPVLLEQSTPSTSTGRE